MDFYDFAAAHGVPSPLTTLLHPRNLLRIRRCYPPQASIPTHSLAQLGEFIRGFTKPRDRVMAELMLLCGLRRCEVLSLPRSILALPIVDDAVTLVVTGKGNVEREMSLDAGMRARLVHYAATTVGSLIFTILGRPCHAPTR